ncbi:MAG: helix-turn-helix transcriptional regulator [Myxococcaceae bacterium]
MSKKRHGVTRLPDGEVVVRTFPVTFLHDQVQTRTERDWHVLACASSGHLEVIVGSSRHLVPADRAVWIPAGTTATQVMRAPISMRSIYLAVPAVPRALRDVNRVRTLEVSPLLRELMIHFMSLGALDRSRPRDARLIAVLFDLLAAARDVSLELRSPSDARALEFARLVTSSPGDPRSNARLARAAGASLRTLERCFRAEAGLSVGAWRRRVRLFHALGRLEGGASVTEAALEVGYASLSAFCQAFARQFGHSPGRQSRPRPVA